MEHISDQKKSRLFLTAMSLSILVMELTLVTGDCFRGKAWKTWTLYFRVLTDQTFPSGSYSV